MIDLAILKTALRVDGTGEDDYILELEAAAVAHVENVTGGYEVGDEPADIRQAVMQLVAHWYEFRTPAVAGMSVQHVKPSVTELLEPHRLFPIE